MTKPRTLLVRRKRYSVTAKSLHQNGRRWEVVFQDISSGKDAKPTCSILVKSGTGISETEACERAERTFSLPKAKHAAPETVDE
jgi:hypothetical protein